jgi:hypothetical protein
VSYSCRYAGLLAIVIAAGCGWTPRQHALATAAVGGLAADWAQTRDIVRACRELNPIIGQCGAGFPVDAYFPLTMVATLAVGAAIGGWRDVLFAGVAGVQWSTVYSNTLTDY